MRIGVDQHHAVDVGSGQPRGTEGDLVRLQLRQQSFPRQDIAGTAEDLSLQRFRRKAVRLL